MAAPILNLSEQKKALSGKIKKKKIIKNVLGLPTSVKIESPVVSNNEAEKLRIILHRLLPLAKIPNIQIKKNEEKEVTVEMENGILEAKEKRKELSLGINDLNRSIKKKLISAAILASDITPKFLVHHLNLLCTHNEVPFLHIPNLRKITQSCLGFPCVALGFRRNFNSFTEAVQKIRTIAETIKQKISSSKNNNKSENDESDEEKPIESSNNTLIKSECDIPFQFLYRNSCTERMFIPEVERGLRQLKKQENDFISLGPDTNENEGKNDSELQGISDNLSRKHKKKLTQLEVINLKEDTSSSEEEYILPKKKPKKSWVIDKTGIKQNFKYSPANIIKVHLNPDRKKRKNK